MRVAAAAPLRAELGGRSLAPNTRALYAAASRLYVVPALGDLRLAELTPAIIDRALGLLRSTRSPQIARASRRALSSLCAEAVRHGALIHNPVRESRPIPCPHRPVRALTVPEARDLQDRVRADHDACRWDLPDLVQFLLGTGVRIGEATAVRTAVLDLPAGTVHINATVIRVPGHGLRLQPRTKTAASERILALPLPILDMLHRRIATTRQPPEPTATPTSASAFASDPAHSVAPNVGPGVVFTSPTGQLRDPSNTAADLRTVLDRAGYPWVTSHTFRRTVASRLDDAGFSIRHIADQFGHARPSTTLDYYLGRRAVTTADFAAALTVLAAPTPSEGSRPQQLH